MTVEVSVLLTTVLGANAISIRMGAMGVEIIVDAVST